MLAITDTYHWAQVDAKHFFASMAICVCGENVSFVDLLSSVLFSIFMFLIFSCLCVIHNLFCCQSQKKNCCAGFTLCLSSYLIPTPFCPKIAGT